jgi:hypothetical protein
MKTYIVPLAAAIVTAGAAHAASVTVTMNAIDANGVGKEIGALLLSDTQAGMLIRTVALGLGRTASQWLAWQRVAITTRLTLANTLDHMGRATRATCQC